MRSSSARRRGRCRTSPTSLRCAASAVGFLTFALDPGKALDKLDMALGDTGAYVIGGMALNRGKLDEHSEVFAERLVDAVAVH